MSNDFPQKLRGYLKDSRIYILGFLIVLATSTIFLFTEYLVTALLVIGVGLVSWTVNQLGIKQVGIELVTFSTVIIAVVYGPYPGALAGLILILFQVVAGQYTGSYIIWVIPSYAVAGFIVGFFPDQDIFTLGALTTVILQAVFGFLSSVSSLGNLKMYLPYLATNVPFNLLLFYYLAPIIMQLMI